MIKESLQVACPRCGAAAGERCVSLKGGTTTVSTHTARDFTYLGKPLSPRWLPSEPKPPKPPSKLALADDLAAAAEAVEKEWEVRGDGGCSVKLQNDLGLALARYQERRTNG